MKGNRAVVIAALISNLLVGMWVGVMLVSNTPTQMLCGGNPPTLGGGLPIVSPGPGVLRHLTLSFTTTTASTSGTCYPVDTPTKISAVASVLAGTPPTLTGVRCDGTFGNPLAFIHLKKQPFQKPRATTDKSHPVPFIDYYGDAPLKVVWAPTGSITVSIPEPGLICIAGLKTQPLRLMATISALVGIPYPFFGEPPDWETLRLWLSKEEYSLAVIRYAELLAYRTGYFQALAGENPVIFSDYTAVAYMYHIKGEYDTATKVAMESIEKLNHILSITRAKLIKSRIYARIPNLLMFLLMFTITLTMLGLSSLTGVAAGVLASAILWFWNPPPLYTVAIGCLLSFVLFATILAVTKEDAKAVAGATGATLAPTPFISAILALYGTNPTFIIPSTHTIQTFTALLYMALGASVIGTIISGATLLDSLSSHGTRAGQPPAQTLQDRPQ